MFNSVLYLFGLVTVTAVNYLIFSYIDYNPTVGLWRTLGIVASVFFYFQLIRSNKFIDIASHRLQQRNLEHKAKFFFASIFGIIHVVLTIELTEAFNKSLLERSRLSTHGRVIECEDSYCICEYSANRTTYKQKFNNSGLGFNSNDTLDIEYFPDNPNIYKLKRAKL